MNRNTIRHLAALCVFGGLVLVGLPAQAQGICSVSEEECEESSDCTGPGEDICVICGDGVLVEGFEECDDSNTFGGDGCDSNCRLETLCGNGVLESGECCDMGSANSDSVPDTCNTDCRVPRCGDGVVDQGLISSFEHGCLDWGVEYCDDEYLNSNFEPNACRLDCTLPFCGDSVVDSGVGYGEECDLGSENSNAAGAICDTMCRLRGCGNGILEVGELCDDGNASDADGCTSQCRHNVCGDGFIWASVEMCEYETPWSRGECRYDCGQNVSICGNGAVDAGEGCDAGGDRNNNEANNPCRTDCQPMRCGDGVVDAGEACDLQEGCAPDCQWVAPR